MVADPINPKTQPTFSARKASTAARPPDIDFVLNVTPPHCFAVLKDAFS
jgi:hypothetical protein